MVEFSPDEPTWVYVAVAPALASLFVGAAAGFNMAIVNVGELMSALAGLYFALKFAREYGLKAAVRPILWFIAFTALALT